MRTVTREIVTTVTETIITINDFKDWLREQGCYCSYFRNLGRYWGFETKQPLLDSMDDPEHLIQRSLDWSESPEGFNYWLKIDENWNNYCKEYSIKRFVL